MSIAEPMDTLPAAVPMVQQTLFLQQRCANLVDKELFEDSVICPYLVGRVVFEPFISFDDQVQQVERISEQALSKDKSALESVQRALGRAWTAVEKKALGCPFHVSRLFSSDFEVVRVIMPVICEDSPPLACDDRIILPPHGVRKPQVLRGNNCVMVDAKDRSARTPCLGVTSASPIHSLYDGEKSMGPLQPRQATEVSKQWNSVLAKENDPMDICTSQHQLWMLDAVTQALYSHSGCAVVWNYRSVVAVRIASLETGASDGHELVRVQVSNIYTAVHGASPMFGLIGAVQIGLKLALGSGGREARRISEEILHKSTQCLVLTRVEIFAKGRSKWLSESRNAIFELETIPNEEFCWISERAAALIESEVGKCKDDASRACAFFDHVLSKYSHVLYASGSMSVLLYGTVGNMGVVTKYANTNLSLGSEMIQNEVVIYDLIRKEHPELLGSCVPNLLGIRMQPCCDPILVLEYVGRPVTLMKSGVVKVGGEPVGDVDRMEIIAAGNHGLDAIEKAGLLHSDESLGNMRAERTMQCGSEKNASSTENQFAWRVWWIDFGSASKREGNQERSDDWYEETGFSSACPRIHFSDGMGEH